MGEVTSHNDNYIRSKRRAGATPTPSQSWSILARHAREEVLPLPLQQLCSDKDRVSSLVSVHSSSYNQVNRILLLDISRQRMTLETVNHLLRLGVSRNLRGYIRSFAWGQNNPDHPIPKEQVKSKRHGIVGQGKATSSSLRRRTSTNNNGSRTGIVSSNSVAYTATGLQSMHMALRVPKGDNSMCMLTADGVNVLDDLHLELSRIERLATSARTGVLRGVTGHPIRDVVVVGKGVSVLALQFWNEALRHDENYMAVSRQGLNQLFPPERGVNFDARNLQAGRRIRFVTSADPIVMQVALEGLIPASTLILSIALQSSEETEIATRHMYNWLCRDAKGYKRESITGHHMFLVTGNERLKQIKPDSTFLISDHSRCEAFGSFTAAGLFPLAIAFGWPVVEDLIAGAHDMDKHFVDTNPRHNLPVLLALTDVWNDAFLGSCGRIITPFSEQLSGYVSLVAAMESETCARSHDKVGNKLSSECASSGIVIHGTLKGEYDRVSYQGGRIFPSELIASMHSPVVDPKVSSDALQLSAHDRIICTLFAHADLMAFGNQKPAAGGTSGNLGTSPYSHSPPQASTSHPSRGDTTGTANEDAGGGERSSDGNRPSSILLCSRCDAFMCGQLVALAEHRALIAAKLWDLDPFVGDVGSSLRESGTEELKDKLLSLWQTTDKEIQEDLVDNGKINYATTTVLTHYANRVKDHKLVS